eukprot:gene24307-biopygen16411
MNLTDPVSLCDVVGATGCDESARFALTHLKDLQKSTCPRFTIGARRRAPAHTPGFGVRKKPNVMRRRPRGAAAARRWARWHAAARRKPLRRRRRRRPPPPKQDPRNHREPWPWGAQVSPALASHSIIMWRAGHGPARLCWEDRSGNLSNDVLATPSPPYGAPVKPDCWGNRTLARAWRMHVLFPPDSGGP